jgi:hypothetical protein
MFDSVEYTTGGQVGTNKSNDQLHVVANGGVGDHFLPAIRRRYGNMVMWCFWQRLSVLIIGFQVVVSVSKTVRAEAGDSPAISGPAVRGAVEPKVSGEGTAGLPPAERYTPGAPVRVMPDLRLSDRPGVNPPVSPGVQERDLREAPRLSPPDPGQPPRAMPDLKETPSNQRPGEGGGRRTRDSRNEEQPR